MATQNAVVSFNFVAQSVRIVMIDDDPWFVGNDVCEALSIANHNDALGRLDDDERRGVGITDPLGIQQTATAINESGLYSLILTSRKPEAKKFKKWITNEVLPAIRKTGRYVAPQVAPVTYISGVEESQMATRIWNLARPFYMEGSVKHWLYQYANALVGVPRRQLIPASQFPEVLAMLHSIEAQIDLYRTERIRHEKEWLLRTLKRELDKRLGRTGPEFEMLTAPTTDLTA